MNAQRNIATSEKVQAAFGRGDVPRNIVHLTDDIRLVNNMLIGG